MIQPDSPDSPDARTLVVGMGNPVLGDDAVGWRVVEELQRRLDGAVPGSRGAPSGPIQTDCLALGGLRLMERLVGYERAIVVDAIVTGERPVGSIAWGELPAATAAADAEVAPPTHTGSAHDTTLETALRLGRALGASLPSEVLVLAIEAGPCFEFGEELSPPVAAAVPRAVDLLLRQLRAGRRSESTESSESIGGARNNGSIGTGTGVRPPTS